MTPFCTDIDLLHWEPNIFRDAAFASQTLMTGTGDLGGTTLSITDGSFEAAHVEPNHVVVISGGLAGSFPVFSVDGATALSISVLYDGLFPPTGAAQPSPPGTASGVNFIIRTFWPQRRVVTEILQQASGIIPGDARTRNACIINPDSLRRPCVLGTLQMIYAALSAVVDAPKQYAVKADLYERIYRRALRSTQVELDLNGDGQADCRRQLNTMELHRR